MAENGLVSIISEQRAFIDYDGLYSSGGKQKVRTQIDAENQKENRRANKEESEFIELTKKPRTEENLEKIKKILDKNGLVLVTNIHIPLTKAEKKVIRIDFYGTIDAPNEDKLSEFYLNIKETERKNKFDISEYDLLNSPSWNLFRQFPNFRKIESQLIEQLHDMGIPPSALTEISKEDKKILRKNGISIRDVNTINDSVKNKLREQGISGDCFRKIAVEDFSDILYLKFRTDENRSNATIFTGTRNSFIMDFATKFGTDFKYILDGVGMKSKHSNKLLQSMKNRGISDIGFDGGYYRKGDAEELRFSIHHKSLVQDAARLSHLAKANLPSKLCFCFDDKHYKLLHSMDKTYIGEDGLTYQDRIEFKDENTIFFGGFSKIYQMSYPYKNLENDKEPNLLERELDFISNEKTYVKKDRETTSDNSNKDKKLKKRAEEAQKKIRFLQNNFFEKRARDNYKNKRR